MLLYTNLLLSFLTLVTATVTNVGNRRIVALGDLHGDLPNTLEILKFAKLIDKEHHWIGGDAIFVQTGDVVDRGPDTIKLYRLLQDLREEAPYQGGLVIPLLGNHEIMNLIGDWRYVRESDVATFGSVEARRKAFAADGFIGEYLITLNMTAKVGSTVFCHGGITPYYSEFGLDWINDRTHESIVTYMESRGRHGNEDGIYSGSGPTWYRGYALDDEQEACDLIDDALDFLQANRMVMGHTVQRDGIIRTRCGGKIVLIDVGISKAYGGYRGALEIQGNDVYALYPNRKVKLPSPAPFITSSSDQKLEAIPIDTTIKEPIRHDEL
ncbi:Metallo-dependent phosphatase-like protein [Mycotypha africana]|uniref:Metallo-dependent phosphatase-like protein n=1 Tax=Mycotypha africana TaxID=64632 RepID=UPI002300FDC7|nr:Metallo-dependent phosphatase-like protein [Mycotypha africana]KAI8975483.1 Metallo-dependent phosphatase-like protein [Mycotypha africana]